MEIGLDRWDIYDMSLPSHKVVEIRGPNGFKAFVPQRNKRNKHYALNQLDGETQFNIRLLAAAPELYGFLIDVRFSLSGECELNHWGVALTEEQIVDKAIAIISKVEQTEGE